MLDASGSIREPNFKTMLDFVEIMVDGFPIGANETQVGLIAFANNVDLQFHLNRFHTKTDIKNAVSQTRYLPMPYRIYAQIVLTSNLLFWLTVDIVFVQILKQRL